MYIKLLIEPNYHLITLECMINNFIGNFSGLLVSVNLCISYSYFCVKSDVLQHLM